MRIGQRIETAAIGLVEYDSDMVTHIRDEESGALITIPKGHPVRELKPKNWPPREGDVWKHLNVSFLVEKSKGKTWLIASNGEGSVSPEEVLRMRPGIHLESRAPENIYSEHGYDAGDPIKPVHETNELPG